MAWTTPKTWTAAAALTAAELNEQVRDNSSWVKDALTLHGVTSGTATQALKSAGYGVSLTASSVSVADQSDVAIQYDTEEWDDASFHSTSTNTARITIPTGGDGRYELTAWVSFEANANNRREAWFEKNSADSYNRVRITSAGSGAQTAICVTCEVSLVAGDYVVVRARQNSGSTLTVASRFQARRTAV